MNAKDIKDRIFDVRHPHHASEMVNVARVVDLDGLGEHYVVLRFVREIMFVRQSETTCVVRNRETHSEFRQGSTCNDFYGYLTSCESPIEQAKNMAAEFGLDTSSKMEAVAKMTIHTHATIIPPTWTTHDRTQFGGKHSYLHVPNDWAYDDEERLRRYLDVLEGKMDADPDARFNPDNRPLYLRDSKPVELIVWSSANTEEENAAAFAAQDAYRA